MNISETTSKEETEETFSFQIIENNIKNDKNLSELLLKWGLTDSLNFHSFRFNFKYNALFSETFLLDLLNSKVVRSMLSFVPFGPENISNIKYNKVSANATNLDLFDKLEDNKIVVKGNIKATFPDVCDGIEIGDLLRETLIKVESEHYELFTPADRNEFLFKVFSLFVLGGSICQYEDKLSPYLDTTKSIYKQLVCARQDPATKSITIDSFVYQITSIESLYKIDGHPQNLFYVIVNPSTRVCNILHNKWSGSCSPNKIFIKENAFFFYQRMIPSKALKYGEPVAIFGLSGEIYLSITEKSPQISFVTERKQLSKAYLFELCPCTEGTEKAQHVYVGDSFYIRSFSNGQFLQRTQMMETDDAPTNPPHYSYRYHLGLVDVPNQVWNLDFGGTKGSIVSLDQDIGISIGGENEDKKAPDNSIRRVMTLRGNDYPQAVVTWWASDEKIRFVVPEKEE